MDHHGYRRGSFHGRENRHDGPNKPQLPSFDHFVQGIGHPDLAYRESPRLDTAFTSPPSGQSSLPTPPATGAPQSAWLVNGRLEQYSEFQSAILEDDEIPSSHKNRRASLIEPVKPVPRMRPTRAQSSTNELRVDSMRSWEHGGAIQEEVMPSRGTSFVYDDGSTMPKEHIGDAVNPRWGTTKAGKPRKRLGQACNTCREKKIKCDPGIPKCSQCLRFNRECFFSQDSRQGRDRSPKHRSSGNSTSSPGATSTYSPKEYLPSRKSSIAPTEASTPTDVVYRTLSRSSNSVDEVFSPIMADRQTNDVPTPAKRPRLSAGLADRSIDSIPYERTDRDATIDAARQLGFGTDIDPVTGNADLTQHYVKLFLEYNNKPTFEIFPRQRFMVWALNNQTKSLPDRLMLYALMAWATVHSDHSDRSVHRAMFRSIVYQEIDRLEAQYCLQVVHTMLFLAIAEVTDARQLQFFSLFARCVGAIAYLQLNVEQTTREESTAYDFTPTLYAECRRRTYWAAFVTDTLAGFSNGNARSLHNADIFLRLPCATGLYEEDRIPTLPTFDQEIVLPRTLQARDYVEMGDMAHLIAIATICSDIHVNARRCQNSLRIGRRFVSDRAGHDKMKDRLKAWAEMYNAAIRAKEGYTTDSADNRETVARADKFAGLDVLYHYAHMELNRRIYHKGLTEQEVASHARSATMHAIELLRLSQQLLETGGRDTRDYGFVIRGALGGYAVHAAVDIITAAGRTSDILQPQNRVLSLMYSGLELLETLATTWASARLQQTQVKERIQAVLNSAQVALNSRKTYVYCSDPMMPIVDKDFDLIYGTNRLQYLQSAYSLKEPVRTEEVFAISTKG